MDNDDIEIGFCDCGKPYIVGSRFDHDADSGQCWNCSPRTMDEMTTKELNEYLMG